MEGLYTNILQDVDDLLFYVLLIDIAALFCLFSVT